MHLLRDLFFILVFLLIKFSVAIQGLFRIKAIAMPAKNELNKPNTLPVKPRTCLKLIIYKIATTIYVIIIIKFFLCLFSIFYTSLALYLLLIKFSKVTLTFPHLKSL